MTKKNDTVMSALGIAAILALSTGACDSYGHSETAEAEAEVLVRAAQESNDLQQAPWAERGRLVAYKLVRTLSRSDVREALFERPFVDAYAGFGLEDFFDFFSAGEINEVTRFRVDVFQVIYETIDPWGQPTVASGAVLMPRGEGGPKEDSALWCLLRGTVFYDADVPSYGDMPDWGIWRGLLPASAGYVTAMPDYLGFGASRHMVHPYLVSEPTATASIDMMRATRRLAAQLDVPLRDEVFLSGHSQGGHAALATQREIEAHHDEEFELSAVAPASGPYAISGTLSFLLGSEAMLAPQVTSLYTLSLMGVYDLGQPSSYYFRPPYDEVVLELHDKTKDNAQIIAGLPSQTTDELFSDEFLADFRGDGALDFKAAMALNDLHTGWAPRAPIRLFHGSEDAVVVPLQGELALAGLAGEGADIGLEIIDGADHLQTIVPSTLRTIELFDGLLAEESE